MVVMAHVLKEYFKNGPRTLTVWIVPHTILVGHCAAYARNVLSRIGVFDVVELTAASFVRGKPPECLRAKSGLLPHLAVITSDFWALLVTSCPDMMEKMSEDGLFGHVCIDEAQTLMSETVRENSTNMHLRHTARLCRSITILSGTLDPVLGGVVKDRIVGTEEEAMVVHSPEVVGDHFEIVVVHYYDKVGVLGNVLREFAEDSNRPVHIVFATASDLNDTLPKLRRLFPSLSFAHLTGQSTTEDKLAVGARWSSGEAIDVLMTTTAGLAGIENHKCGAVVIVGVIYGSSLQVQAMSRLRLENSAVRPALVLTMLSSKDLSPESRVSLQEEENQLLARFESQGYIGGGNLCEKREACRKAYSRLELLDSMTSSPCLRQGLAENLGGSHDGECNNCSSCNPHKDIALLRNPNGQRPLGVNVLRSPVLRPATNSQVRFKLQPLPIQFFQLALAVRHYFFCLLTFSLCPFSPKSISFTGPKTDGTRVIRNLGNRGPGRRRDASRRRGRCCDRQCGFTRPRGRRSTRIPEKF